MNEEPNNQDNPQPPAFAGEEMKMPENSAVEPVVTEKPAVPGAMLLILGVLLMAILVGLFLWFTTMQENTEPTAPPAPIERPTPEENNEPESTTAEAQTDNLETVSTSDEISAIESDIEATDIESLDAELEAIEAELDAAI
jgi:cytoskeletal protein RodZ